MDAIDRYGAAVAPDDVGCDRDAERPVFVKVDGRSGSEADFLTTANGCVFNRSTLVGHEWTSILVAKRHTTRATTSA